MTQPSGGGTGTPNKTLEQLLDDLLDWLEDLVDAIGTSAGPLSGEALQDATTSFNGAEGEIETLRDSNSAPSLDPADAGDADTSVSPSGLPAYAQACVTLAQAAITEYDGNCDHDLIGDKIATIESLMPEIKQLAGIG